MSVEISDEIFKRLVLINQYRMLALLDTEDRAFWERAADMTREGWPVEDLPDVREMQSYLSDPLTRADQEFVLDALDVFEKLQDAEKRGMKPKGGGCIDFLGFDANNESKLLGYARHAVLVEHRFESISRAAKDFNSHMPTVEIYERMIDAWNRCGRPQVLSEVQFQEILNAQVHPENRIGAPLGSA